MSKPPVRVLYVLGSLDRGGAETWAVQLLESIDRKKIELDFLVHRRGGVYEERIRSCGSQIYFLDPPNQLIKYSSNLRRLFQGVEPYHVIHSHLQLFSGLVLWIANGSGIRGRIAHARNSDDGQKNSFRRRIYRKLMQYLLNRNATHLFAVSTEAAHGAFWNGVLHDSRFQILSGIDFSAFGLEDDRENVRAEFDIPADSPVIGHVGSFRHQKNHQFILRIAQEIIPHYPNIIFLLIGDGILRSLVEDEVSRLSLNKHFIFTGERNDIPRVLQAMDVFVFPSLYEGLPRAVLEAQAAGLTCVVSNTITREAAARYDSVTFMPLESGPITWTEFLIKKLQNRSSRQSGIAAIKAFESRGLSIKANMEYLTQLYETITYGEATTYPQ